jgi:hypothetical protein
MAKSQRTRPTRPLDELQEAAQHVCYEIDMLRATTHCLAAGISDEVIKNAILESFAVWISMPFSGISKGVPVGIRVSEK